MKVAEARRNFAGVLRAAEAGEVVVIERRGVRFRIQVERPRHRPRRRKLIFQLVDPAVKAGRWTWTWAADGLEFTPRRRR